MRYVLRCTTGYVNQESLYADGSRHTLTHPPPNRLISPTPHLSPPRCKRQELGSRATNPSNSPRTLQIAKHTANHATDTAQAR